MQTTAKTAQESFQMMLHSSIHISSTRYMRYIEACHFFQRKLRNSNSEILDEQKQHSL